MRGGSLLLFFALVLFFPLPSDQIGGGFLVCYFFLSFSSFICVFGYSDGMEREACVCDHGFERSDLCAEIIIIIIIISAGRPGSSEVPRNPLTRWDVSSIPANGIFLTKKLKNKIKMPNGWRTIKSLVHKIRLHSRRGKGMAESFSREKLRHAPQKEGGGKILCDLPV